MISELKINCDTRVLNGVVLEINELLDSLEPDVFESVGERIDSLGGLDNLSIIELDQTTTNAGELVVRFKPGHFMTGFLSALRAGEIDSFFVNYAHDRGPDI